MHTTCIAHSFLSVEILSLIQLHESVTCMLLKSETFNLQIASLLHKCACGVMKHNNLVLARTMFRCFVAMCNESIYLIYNNIWDSSRENVVSFILIIGTFHAILILVDLCL